MGVIALLPQKSNGVLAVYCHMQIYRAIDVAEGLLHESGVSGTVFHQKDVYGHAGSAAVSLVIFALLAANSKRKVEPCPGCDSTEMLPPWRSTMRLHTANPMPVPSYSVRLCSRWNIPKILSKYCGSIPRRLP